jgi:hypothetical protein
MTCFACLVVPGRFYYRNYFPKISKKLLQNNKINSVALVRKQTIPTERPPHVGEVSAAETFLSLQEVHGGPSGKKDMKFPSTRR